jgi:DNA helicase-2/ATP-dependent DNA helicase PcrA
VHYTPEQEQIIHHNGGHARIIAVAGSGKTQTLTAYVQQRLSQGLDPKRLLVLMYNKTAQLDFERRLRAQSEFKRLPDVRTFHSLGYRICQSLVRQNDMPAFKKDLLSDVEIEQALWMILRRTAPESLVDDILSRKKKWVEPMVAYLDRVKSSLASPELVFEQTGLPKSCQFFVECFYRFEDWRSEQARLSFADLLYEPVQRFIKEPHLAKQFGGHMAEIIVDEFQDINPIQQTLLDVLHGGRAQLMVVGDPDQTIYEFRGSSPELLTDNFAQHYHPLSDYQLSHTFRFGDQLSLVANQVIAANYVHHDAQTQCHSHEVAADTQIQSVTSSDSAAAAVNIIKRVAQSRQLADIVVINRIWATSARLELLLLSAGIPFRSDQPTSLLDRHELKPFRLLFQIAAGEHMSWSSRVKRLAWQVLLTQPYLKIKKAIIDQLVSTLSKTDSQWGQALRNAVPTNLSRYQSDALFERARWIEKAERRAGDASVIVQGWIQATDYLAALKDSAFSSSAVEDQQATVKAFAQYVRSAQWSLASAAEELLALQQARTADDEKDALLITSIHKSKGREWPVVILPEVNSRYYPYQPDGEMMMASSVASERRLLYVAMTRAKEQLYILLPAKEADADPSPLLHRDFVSGAKILSDLRSRPDVPLELPANMHRPSVAAYVKRYALREPSWAQSGKSTGGQAATVRHPTLGIGQIVHETDARIQIHFLQGDTVKTFDRAVVTPLLEWLG